MPVHTFISRNHHIRYIIPRLWHKQNLSSIQFVLDQYLIFRAFLVECCREKNSLSIIQSSSYATVDCCRLPLKICLVSKRKVASSSSLLTLKALRQYGHFGTLVNASPHLYYPLLWAYIFYSIFVLCPVFRQELFLFWLLRMTMFL